MTSDLLDQPEFHGKPRKVFICSTPRSGSYMLCRHMINAGLGIPHEYFNPIIMRQIAPRLGLGDESGTLTWRRMTIWDRFPFQRRHRVAERKFLSKYITALIRRRCQNGIFGAKIHFDQFVTVLDNPIGRELLDGGLFIHLFREDLLKQAVSRNFAYVTGRWGDDEAVTTTPLAQGDLLDIDHIDRELETLATEDRGWRVFLARNGLAPMSISYEQLCKDPNGFVSLIADRIGVDSSSLRHGYTEPAMPSERSDAELPTKGAVAERYLAAVRQLHGLSTLKTPPSTLAHKTVA